MATDWQALASEQAELISSRLRELLSSGQGYIRSQFGLELGLRPELYPSWAVLSSAAAALLGLLLLSWAAVCGGGKKPSKSASQNCTGEPLRASVTNAFKPEEQKKKNKKKSVNKKAQSNGHTVPEPQEEVRASEEISKPSPPLAPEIKTEKVKKNKKKPKPEVKSAQSVSSADGKEPDDGAWETKVSNREKRQQRRKDKGPDGSGSPGRAETPSYPGNPPAVSALIPPRKNREPLHVRTAGKGDAVIAPVCPSWREEPSVNGGGWANVSMKPPAQMSALEGDKWPAMPTVPRHRNPEPQSWGQETEGTWSGSDCRIKTEINSVTFSVLGMNTTAGEPRTHPPADLQWERHPTLEDEWSGFNGVSVADPSSDWNAPTELWGNYEEPPVVVAPPPQEQPAPQAGMVSDEEKENAAGGGATKSKKKKKKKKKAEDEGTPAQGTRESSVPPVANTLPKAQPREEPPPAVISSKQTTTIPSFEKKSDQISDAPKPAQKKKVRRET